MPSRQPESADRNFLQVIDEADDEKCRHIDERLEETSASSEAGKDNFAVTSCPTGIAHTYMAAEGLEKAAKNG